MCQLVRVSHSALPSHSQVISVDSRRYAPSEPFEEAGPTSSIWRAYLDESLIYDMDMLGNQRGQVNILLVFVSSFSRMHATSVELISLIGRTVLGDCGPPSLCNPRQTFSKTFRNYRHICYSNQNNIQRAIASGTPLDKIATIGTDPTARFTPKPLDLWVNGLWFASLTLSLATALFAMLADEWYCHYLSPVAGDPQVRSRTRQLRYTGLMEWRVTALINLLPLMLHLSLGLFFVGLVLSLLPLQHGIALVIGILSLATFTAYFMTNVLPILYPACPYKTPLSSVGYAIIMWIHRHSSTLQSAMPSRKMSKFPAGTKTLDDFEIHDAKTFTCQT